LLWLVWLTFLWILFSALLVSPQATQTNHETHSHGGPVPEAIAERPVTLHSGIGRMHQKVTTSLPTAQSFYDQGLAYLHSYVWIEAVRSFNQALRLDPKLGMAYLGLADAYIGLQDVAAARTALNTAAAPENHFSDRERVWLIIRQHELDYLEASDDREKYTAYLKSATDATKTYPADPWLWIQRGLADEGSPFTHGQTGGTDSLACYRTALKLEPNNLAALHYSAHVHENLGQIETALNETAAYARLAPAIPHAHHMHGHELMRLGRTADAIQEFLKAKQLEDNYYRAENIPAQYDWHHAHNLELLALNYQILGQAKSADAVLREAFALPAYTEFLDYNRRVWPEFLINRARFQEALEASRTLTESQWAMARLAGHTLAGEALLGLNRLMEAEQELALAEHESAQLPPRTAAALPYPAALRASIWLRENQTQAGEELTVKVEESMLAKKGPDGWMAAEFALESIARDARQAGDWDLARFTAEQMIRHNPYYAGGHFALALVAEHAGEDAGAREMFAAAEKLWNNADPDLPELATTRKRLTGVAN
jgi:tetratricopeptide (TPR) repeat protein